MLHRAALIGVLLAACAFITPGLAQSSIAVVNGEPITNRDVEQRMRVSSQLFRQPLSRAAALQELIDERIKLAEGRRLGMRMTPAGLEDSMSRLASSVRQTPAQFEQSLAKAGIDSEAVKAKISGQAIWTELLRQRARSQNISNADLNAELEHRTAKGEAKVTDFVIRQIVFVVPAGTNPGQRERDASAARGRFTDCETGVDYMRTLRDVAVKERIGRSSVDLPKQTLDLLNKTPVGRLTSPFRSEQGIEMIAVCERTERQDNMVLRGQIEQEMMQKRTEGSASSYMNELRAKAEIRR
jgi:peptidyl-prolyl cis-trans isomerase SurA